MKVIVAGTRTFIHYRLLNEVLDDFMKECCVTEIVSGGAKGADQYGEIWAEENSIPVKIFEADWARHGKAAGPKRNQQMANYADYLIAFWDDKSRGTKSMIDKMYRENKPVKVVHYKQSIDISF